MATRRSSTSGVVEIKPLQIETFLIPIEGVTGLIVHRFAEKARKAMLDKQMGVARPKKENKDPQADYEASLYRLDDGGYGFPAAAFKAAIIGACRLYDGLPMTQAKIAIFVEGEPTASGETLVRIDGEPQMREDMVRLETGVADIRYRAWFPTWRASLRVTANTNIISRDQLYNLVNAAGMGGIGEWRPSAPKSATGDFGRFRVVAR